MLEYIVTSTNMFQPLKRSRPAALSRNLQSAISGIKNNGTAAGASINRARTRAAQASTRRRLASMQMPRTMKAPKAMAFGGRSRTAKSLRTR